MSADHIRRCPTCGTENDPQVMRCACGAMLAGVDLAPARAAAKAASPPEGQDALNTGGASVTPVAVPAPITPEAHDTPAPTIDAAAAADIICQYQDCAQRNPCGSDNCLYCNRPLAHSPALSRAVQLQSLVSLPAALKNQYRIIEPLPVQGGEAELLLVEDFSGGPARVAKIYRHGIQPRPEVQQRIARIDPAHRVEVFAFGISDGHAYELMEHCVHGSLRKYLNGPLSAELLQVLVREIASALAGVHEVGLLHRDLKPENILVRTGQPLDLVLTDFGISSVMEATQRFTGTARTLPYAAPESLSGVIDAKSDYWALGMIILEGALGKHPFQGLSEAVILHHLTTRNIDLAAVADRNVRKLLRGLLLRDPKARWGRPEITRWLAKDASLPEPAEQGVAGGAREPYHIADEICHNNEQLAVALARNWRAGLQDMANGLLLAWLRDVQKDQNAMRRLLDLRQDQKLPVDLQLLKMILHLAPGIPPVWRGETVELPAILSHANLALKGDAAAAKWLDQLYQYRVLESYAEAGNQTCASIVQKWTRACDQFDNAWDEGMKLLKAKAPPVAPHEYVNFDRLVYGGDHADRPSTSEMHARLLAIAYDPQWAERLRQRLTAELIGIIANCPWMAAIGNTATLDGPALLVLESLMPEARRVNERQIQASGRKRATDESECAEIRIKLQAATAAIGGAAGVNPLYPINCVHLRACLEQFFDIAAQINASGRDDAPWQELRKSLNRSERTAGQMQMLVDTLAEQQAENAGWLNIEMLGTVLLTGVILSAFINREFAYGMGIAALAVLGWRLFPVFSLARKIQGLAGRL